MQEFYGFLTEASEDNKALGDIGEITTVLYLHNSSTASQKEYKKNPDYRARIDALVEENTKWVDQLGEDHPIVKKGIAGGEACAKHWIDTVTKEGVDINMIDQIHWTPKGIKEFFPAATQQSDPPDCIVRWNDGQSRLWAGISLKVGGGITFGNEGAGAYDRAIGTNAGEIWNKHKEAAIRDLKKALKGKRKFGHDAEKKLANGEEITSKELKQIGREGLPATQAIIKKHYNHAQEELVKDFNKKFNSLSDEKRREFLLDRFHANAKTTLPLYVASIKESHSVDDMPIVRRLRNSEGFEAVNNGRDIIIRDLYGPLIRIEARSTHGPFNSNQFNAKLTGDKSSWNAFEESQNKAIVDNRDEQAKKMQGATAKHVEGDEGMGTHIVPNPHCAGDAVFYSPQELLNISPKDVEPGQMKLEKEPTAQKPKSDKAKESDNGKQEKVSKDKDASDRKGKEATSNGKDASDAKAPMDTKDRSAAKSSKKKSALKDKMKSKGKEMMLRPRAPAPQGQKRNINWEAIQRAFTSTKTPVPNIAAEFGVDPSIIYKHARYFEWKRPRI